MRVKLTESQMATLKSMMEICETFADQILHIMRNSGLDKVDGSAIRIEVCPEFKFVTEMVKFGWPNNGSGAGYIELAKGDRLNDRFQPTGKYNSAEYECLFADEAIKRRMEKILHPDKPLPPDGLWISVYDNPPDVDCGVQVDDGLAE